MDRRLLDKWLAPWVFVLTGIVFNILSAVITHYFIGLNNDEINVIDRDIRQKQVLIDSLWQSKTEVERKKEFFILLLTQNSAAREADASALTEGYYQTYLKGLVDTHNIEGFNKRLGKPATSDPNMLLELSNTAQQTIIESINNTYFETLELQEARKPLERSNAGLFSIAIFLQVIGLILVLARDLRRQ